MKAIPESHLLPCATPGKIERLDYGNKYFLLYTPIAPAERILYLIHGGGGDQHAFFCPAFLNMVDHMIARGEMAPLYIVSPCFYAPAEQDKTPPSSGVAVAKFPTELRNEIIPLAEAHAGRAFDRSQRFISGFSMGAVATWYAFLQALDLFAGFIPLSGDCWVMGEKGGGSHPDETAARLSKAWEEQGRLPFDIHAWIGDADIAFPNLDPQIRAMRKHADVFGERLEYSVLPGGLHEYEVIFRYLYNALPEIAPV